MLFTAILGFLKMSIGPVFTWLNARVDADKQIQIASVHEVGVVGTATLSATSKADEINGQIRVAEGKWSPWLIGTIVLFMLPFGYHTTLVVLDSCPWVPEINTWYGIPYLEFARHLTGSWNVKALPGLFEQTEHAVIQSLFIGAASAATGVAIVRAIKR